jgi:hypothetical protein
MKEFAETESKLALGERPDYAILHDSFVDRERTRPPDLRMLAELPEHL